MLSNKNYRLYIQRNKNINLYELDQLCDTVGWAPRSFRKLKKVLDNSFLIFTIVQRCDNTDRLIGFARVTSDCTFNATIWDVVIHPNFQHRGFGKFLILTIIKDLKKREISNIHLFSDAHAIGFYKKLGFFTDSEGSKGMFWYPI
uniref:GNAT family acetyltransferase n=1 Tax=Cyanidium sp. THAL103 TaxID=3027999 RepID=A0A9Y1I463_9RHOD|nr:GNAT family acetyltransferase [Cyanidium sp. THAL103]